MWFSGGAILAQHPKNASGLSSLEAVLLVLHLRFASTANGHPMAYWLMKSEPGDYSIEDLERDKMEPWDGIRNYQVRNMIRDDMRIGDEVLFYHSSCKIPGAVGLATIVSDAYPDPTQFDPRAKHFDPKSKETEPRWLLRDVAFKRRFSRIISLKELKAHPALADFRLNQRGNRLSVFPVEARHWKLILSLE
jgi:predicted RNA-binding protein with PUA-like domain